jgi:hypothetical protein
LSSSSSLQSSSLLAKNCEKDVEEKHESRTWWWCESLTWGPLQLYRAVDDGDQHCGVACGDDCGRNCASGRSGSDRIDEHLAQHTRGLHVREWTLAHGHRYRLHHRSSLLSAPSSSGIFIPSCLPAHHLLSSFL